MLTDFNRPRGSNGDFSFIQLDSITQLREFIPWWEGQVLSVKGYYAGSNRGGGDFVARLGEGVDDGGYIITTNKGFYWERINFDQVTPQLFGALGDGVTDDTNAISKASICAVNKEKTFLFPEGTYTSSALTIKNPVNIIVVAGAKLNFDLYIMGTQFDYSASVNTTMGWADCPAGTNSIPGNFSSFTIDKPVAIKLPDTSGGSASYNETGSDITNITSATADMLSLTTPTRLAYLNPEIQSLSAAVKFTGTLSADDYFIPGDFTAYFKKDDIVRIENIDGTDGVNASSFYFEVIKIKAIDTTGITLKKRLSYNHANPWLVKTGYLSGVTITGEGYIQKVTLKCLSGVIFRGIRTARVVSGFLYDFEMSDIRANGNYDASTFNNTFIFGESKIHSIIASGSQSTTDNASFKVMSSPGLTVTDVSLHDANATGSQGNYGFFVDAIYTPYCGANRSTVISNIKVEPSRSASVSRSIWFFGMREATVSNISGSGTFFQGCVDTVFSDINVAKYYLQIQDLVRSTVRGKCKNAFFAGGVDNEVDLMCTGIGETGSSLNIAIRIGGGTKNPETGSDQVVGGNNRFDIISLSDSASAVTMNISYQDYIVIGSKCRDKTTVASSITLGAGVTNPSMEFNFLKGNFSTGSGWKRLRQFGGFELPSYLNGTMLLNGYYFWMGSDGVFRASTDKPTSNSPSGALNIGPVKKATAVTNSTGSDTADVTVNALMAALRTAGILSQS